MLRLKELLFPSIADVAVLSVDVSIAIVRVDAECTSNGAACPACEVWSRIGALADLGFRGLDNGIRPVIVTGYTASRTHNLTSGQKQANRVLAVGRAPVEHGFAHLKNWRILTKLRTDPAHATRLLRRSSRPDEPRDQLLTHDRLRGLTPATGVSTPRTDHASPLTCCFKLAKAHGA